MKKAINGRAKGKTGEREVAAFFAAWWGEHEPGCRFVSTPLSGGFSTPAVRGDMKVAGDLCTNAKQWPFTVEVKRREAFVLTRVFAGKPSPVWKWWRQAVRAAREEKRVPFLLFRKNRESEWMVMVPRRCFPKVPSFDNWEVAPLHVDVAGVLPLLTTWDAFRLSCPIKGIIKACRAYELPLDDLSSTSSPAARRQPALPLKGLNPPPQPPQQSLVGELWPPGSPASRRRQAASKRGPASSAPTRQAGSSPGEASSTPDIGSTSVVGEINHLAAPKRA